MAATSLLLFACSQPQDPSILAIVATIPNNCRRSARHRTGRPAGGWMPRNGFERLREDLQTLVDRELLLIASPGSGSRYRGGGGQQAGAKRGGAACPYRNGRGGWRTHLRYPRGNCGSVRSGGGMNAWKLSKYSSLPGRKPTGAVCNGWKPARVLRIVAAEFAVDPVVRVPVRWTPGRSGLPAVRITESVGRNPVRTPTGPKDSTDSSRRRVCGGQGDRPAIRLRSKSWENPLRKQLEKEESAGIQSPIPATSPQGDLPAGRFDGIEHGRRGPAERHACVRPRPGTAGSPCLQVERFCCRCRREPWRALRAGRPVPGNHRRPGPP